MPYQKTREGRLVNEITLGDGYPLSNDKQPLKVGGEASIINVSSPTPDGSVDGEVEVKGNFKAKDTFIQGNLKCFTEESTTPQFVLESKQGVNSELLVRSAANSRASLKLRNSQGYFELRREYSTTSLQFTDGTNTPLTLDGNNVEFTNLTDGSITIDSFVDEDNMSSNSATKIPTQQSVKAYVDNEVAGLVDSAPAALDTLNELAAALNDDASFSTTITNSLATKVGLTGDETVAGHKKFSDDVLIAGSAADPATDDEVSLGVSAAQFRVHTNHGYVQIGPANTNWSHFYTDRDRYYFNKPVIVDGDYIASYNEDLVLRRVYNDTSYNQITLGDDSFELKLDNTARLNIDGSGNVGIGTTSPSRNLQIGDGTSAAEVLTIVSSNTGLSQIGLGDSADDNRVQLIADHNQDLFSIQTGGGAAVDGSKDRLVIDSSGKVGIGTTSPTSELHVVGDIQLTGGGNNIVFGEPGDATSQNYAIKTDGNLYLDIDKDNDNTGNFFQFRSNQATKSIMRIKDTGEVGIGTTSPDELLHIASETDPTLVLQCPTNNQTNSGTISFRESGTTDQMAIKYNGSTNNLIIDTASVSNAFVLQRADGHIGIGTDSPTTTLDVEGTVSYKHTAFSTAGPTDNIDVSDTTVLEVDTSSNNVIIGGFTGGVQGQILYIVKTNTANFIQLEHNEGGGSQDIFITTGSDERVVGYGGYTLYCNGTSWFSLSNPTGGADAG